MWVLEFRIRGRERRRFGDYLCKDIRRGQAGRKEGRKGGRRRRREGEG